MRIARMLGWKVLLEESGIGNKFACGIRNPGLWNPESSSMNPESHQQLESEIQVLIFKKMRNPVLESGNPQRGIQNPRPSLTWGDSKI